MFIYLESLRYFNKKKKNIIKHQFMYFREKIRLVEIEYIIVHNMICT
jgi:hypothetical protein